MHALERRTGARQPSGAAAAKCQYGVLSFADPFAAKRRNAGPSERRLGDGCEQPLSARLIYRQAVTEAAPATL